MTYWILLVIALSLSIVSLKWRNILFSLGGTLGWVALWAYHQAYPPLNIAVGSFVHEVLYYAYIIFAIAVMLVWIGNVRRGYTGYPMTRNEEARMEERNRTPARGLMDLSPEEYRTYIRGRMTMRRRR